MTTSDSSKKIDSLPFEERFRFFILRSKEHNRSFPLENTKELLNELIDQYSYKITFKEGTKFYWAKIHDTIKDFGLSSPLEYQYNNTTQNCGGRFNPPGFSYQYLSKEMETAIYEVKPLLSAYVTIFTLTLNKDIQIIDFSKITSGAVRLAAGADSHKVTLIDTVQFLVSSPVLPQLRHIHYASTQIISDFIKSKRYDGIGFPSSVKEDGTNYVLFDKNYVSPNNGKRKVVRISKIKYKYNDQ